MHLLAAQPGGFVDDEGIIDLDQTLGRDYNPFCSRQFPRGAVCGRKRVSDSSFVDKECTGRASGQLDAAAETGCVRSV